MPLPSEGAVVPLVASPSLPQNSQAPVPISPTLESASVESMIASLIQERSKLPKHERKRRRAIDCKLYGLRHKDSCREYHIKYYQSNKQEWVVRRNKRTPKQIAKASKATREWQLKHPERKKGIANNWYHRHRTEVQKRIQMPERKAKIAAYLRLRRKSDPDFRLRCTLRSRIKAALKSQAGKGEVSAVALIGCSIAELKAHLESQFTGAMCWGEARRSWHIDHYVPLSAFNLHDTEELYWACNWRNLRPLTGKDNREKHRLIPDPLPDWLPAHITERIKSRKNHLPL